MRLRTIQAGPLMQMPVFLLLFIAPVYVPLALLGDTLHAVRAVQPGHLRARVGPRLPGGRPDPCRARVRPPARGSRRLLGVGAPRAALGRSRRVDARPQVPSVGSRDESPGPESRFRSALRGTGTAPTSRSPRRTPSASSSACSTTTTSRPASSSRARRRTTGTGICPASAPASATAIASTGPGRPSRATASTPTSS